MCNSNQNRSSGKKISNQISEKEILRVKIDLIYQNGLESGFEISLICIELKFGHSSSRFYHPFYCLQNRIPAFTIIVNFFKSFFSVGGIFKSILRNSQHCLAVGKC